MVWGPMGNCAKRPQPRRPKVGGLKGRGQGQEPGLDPGRVRWGARPCVRPGRGQRGACPGVKELAPAGPPLPSSAGPAAHRAARPCSLLLGLDLGDQELELKVSLCHRLLG